MTAGIEPDSKSPSRRAVLAAAAGAAAAFAARAITDPTKVRAAGDDGTSIAIGGTYGDVQSQTTLGNKANSQRVLWVASNNDLGHGDGVAITGYSYSYRAIEGISTLHTGVYGQGNIMGVFGTAPSVGVLGIGGGGGVSGEGNVGVAGRSTTSGGIGLRGQSTANSTGVLGASGSLPEAKAKTGVYGEAAQDRNARGVWGHSPAGHGVHGQSDTGWAGYFDGRIFGNSFLELRERSNPSAPISNRARLFVRDNGSGKTQLCVRFHNGVIRVIATQ